MNMILKLMIYNINACISFVLRWPDKDLRLLIQIGTQQISSNLLESRSQNAINYLR